MLLGTAMRRMRCKACCLSSTGSGLSEVGIFSRKRMKGISRSAATILANHECPRANSHDWKHGRSGAGRSCALGAGLVRNFAVHEHWLRCVITSRLRSGKRSTRCCRRWHLPRWPASDAGAGSETGPRLVVPPGGSAGSFPNHARPSQRAPVDRYAKERATGGTPPVGSPLAWLIAMPSTALVQQALHRLSPRDADLLVLNTPTAAGPASWPSSWG